MARFRVSLDERSTVEKNGNMKADAYLGTKQRNEAAKMIDQITIKSAEVSLA